MLNDTARNKFSNNENWFTWLMIQYIHSVSLKKSVITSKKNKKINDIKKWIINTFGNLIL